MASQTVAATSWASVSRAGDTGIAWGGIATAVNVADGVIVSHLPFTTDPPTAFSANSPILRVAFNPMSLPPGDLLVSLTLTVRHKSSAGIFATGSAVVYESGGGTASGVTLGTSYQETALDLSGVSIATLNSGAILDLLYKGVGGPWTLPFVFPETVPLVEVDYAQISAVTMTPGLVGGGMGRIPSIGIN